jgi:hypothetical protein
LACSSSLSKPQLISETAVAQAPQSGGAALSELVRSDEREHETGASMVGGSGE